LLDALAPEEIALALAAADEVSARKANRNLIHPRFGNFVLLGTVLLDREASGV